MDEQTDERLPCGHTKAEHEEMAIAGAMWKLFRWIFYAGFIVGGVVAIIAMLVFR